MLREEGCAIKVIREYEPVCKDRKSFYGKARVRVYEDGTEVLRSYKTDVMTRKPDGSLVRHWDRWSATTGRHVAAFAGINKAAWDRMEAVPIDSRYRE